MTEVDVFDPFGDITIAQTLTLACRLHSIYRTGKADFVQGSPWYQVYVDYAVDNGIIKKNEYPDLNAAATRSQFAAILSKSLDAAALPVINTVDDDMIPDVSMKSANADAIYTLYRAGILIGNDKIGTFTPDTKIQRAAVATIVTRMALPNARQKITLKQSPSSKYVMYEKFPDVPDFGALCGVEPKPEKTTDYSSYPAEVRKMLEQLDELTKDMTTYYYDASKVIGMRVSDSLMKTMLKYSDASLNYEHALEECGFELTFYTNASGKQQSGWTGHGLLVSWDIANKDVGVYIQPNKLKQ